MTDRASSIVDDHAVVRAGLRLLLDAEDDIETVGEAGNGARGDLRGAVDEARRRPDGRRDARAERARGRCRRCCTSSPSVKVLVLSMQDDPRYVREAFAVGASGYVLKEAADTEVVAAIREVAAGGRYVHPDARRPPGRGGGRGAPRAPRPIRSRSASARSCGCSRSVTRTRRSRRCSTSRCAPRRPTARTSCRSSGSRPARSSSATRSRTASSRARSTPDHGEGGPEAALSCSLREVGAVSGRWPPSS